MYYWGQYSETSYCCAKEPCDQSTQAHLGELQRIIEKSGEMALPVPPGVYAEYGFCLFRQGDAQGAVKLFEQEKALYPESTVFMDRLINAAKQRDDTKNEADSGKGSGDVAATAPTQTPPSKAETASTPDTPSHVN
ncbi:hypothetical protein GGQ74_002716 [Desulfobaculum xiamenense]|uniref:Tetratricopeptide repeat-containing protein n=1 Tax=Desulfobaculum xiamenense TaxID=995050 RepID=A0A846QRA6_9BACT|nr:DUF4810 domain-containing protein [Desulfobaculum xiamenense]NJB69022.1 hypothetical protein [Desulfobaculum xiamenense]